MLPKQLSIKIENNKVTASNEVSGFSEIEINGKKYKFPDAYILPGLVESHCHIWGLGMILHDPNFINFTSVKVCIDEIKRHKPNKGDWYFGRGWNNELWHDKSYPDKHILDEILPDNPAFFFRIDGHTAWVNSKALEIAGIDKNTPNPSGGEILKNTKGEPSGILIDNAMNLIFPYIPEYSSDRLEVMILDALQKYAEVGVTEIHDLDAPPQYVYKYLELDKKNALKQRIKAYVSAQNDEYIKHNIKPYKGKMYEIVGLKFYIDGALGSRGAALLEDYDDDSGNKGLILIDEEELFEKISRGIEQGFQIATHAIGDAANEMIINIYERIRNKYGNEPILRIEHAQTVQTSDVDRIAKLNIKLAVQPIHCTSDAEMALARLGATRCRERAYLWKSFLDKGIKIMGGSDSPIEPFNPFKGIDAFVNRKSIAIGKPFFPEEIISLSDAINAYSANVHENLQNEKCESLSQSAPLSFTVIDNDLSNNISETKVLATISEGQMIYVANPSHF